MHLPKAYANSCSSVGGYNWGRLHCCPEQCWAYGPQPLEREERQGVVWTNPSRGSLAGQVSVWGTHLVHILIIRPVAIAASKERWASFGLKAHYRVLYYGMNTFQQYVYSIGFKSMTFALLTQCSTRTHNNWIKSKTWLFKIYINLNCKTLYRMYKGWMYIIDDQQSVNTWFSN